MNFCDNEEDLANPAKFNQKKISYWFLNIFNKKLPKIIYLNSTSNLHADNNFDH